jgi:hypothetical protein
MRNAFSHENPHLLPQMGAKIYGHSFFNPRMTCALPEHPIDLVKDSCRIFAHLFAH